MKSRLLLAIFAGSVLCGITAWADPPSQVGRLSLISGSVSFLPGSLNEWTPATLNYPLTAGDHLWTDTGARAEVHVEAAAIRLSSSTEFSFLSLDDETVQVRVSEGTLNVSLRSADSGTTFEIDTPNATVSLRSAGSYRIEVQPDGETAVSARAGSAEVTAGVDAYAVSAGQSTVISGTDSITSYVMAAAQSDEWDDWCTSRDRREDQLASNLHVSRQMIGAEDLNENGTWFVEAGDGPAWTPSHVPAAWAPYRFGHWTWVEPWGWTWIDDMAWGFAPFHYGRWAYLNARWVWSPGAAVPHPVYAPALVVFVGGPGWTPAGGESIGWFPLGPREAYYPSYLVSASYVQRINVGLSNINVQTIETFNPNRVVYVNRGAPQGVTCVSRDVFVQSRPAGGAVLSISAADLTRAPLMGMTARVVPQRESIIAKPIASRAPVPQPEPGLMSKRVYSRVAPPPVQIPFAQQQQMLKANPGQPVDPAVLSGIQRRQRPVSVVTMVNPATLTTLKRPPVLKNAPPIPAPGSRQKPAAPAPSSPQPVVRQAPGSRQKPAAPAPSSQPRTTTPASVLKEKPTVTPPPPGRQPAISTPGGQKGSSAATLIAALKTRTLPDADRLLSEARKVAGIRIDLNAVATQLAAAKESLAGAEKDMAGGNSDQAAQKATAIQEQIGNQMNQLSAAMQAAKQNTQKR
jgi:hypothetical protein